MRERTLLEKARRGEMDAFADLFEPLRPMVYAIGFRIAGPDDADDVVMNTFLKAWRALPRFGGRSSLKTWLYRIARNAALDLVRSRKRHEGVALVDGEGEELDVGEMADRHRRTPAEEAAGRDTVAGLDAALGKLSAAMRTTLLLRFADGMSYAEVAAATGVSIGTVMSRIFNGRRKLRSLMEEQER